MDNQSPNPSPLPPAQKAPENKAKTDQTKDASVKSLAVVGLIAILALFSVGIIKIAPEFIRDIASAAVSFSSVFVPAPKMPVALNLLTVTNGESFIVSWAPPANETGSYTISYPCIDEFHLEAVNPSTAQDGTQTGNEVIFCNTAFQFLNNNNSITLAAYVEPSNPSASIQVPITVYFSQNGASKETAETTVTETVIKSNVTTGVTETAGTPTVSTQTYSGGGAAVSAGQTTETTYPVTTTVGGLYNPNIGPDLIPHILATGIISTTTDAFVSEDSVNPTDRAAIQFDITNQGGQATGPWSFAVVLPTFPGYIFQSQSQPSLSPGDKIVYTIGFDHIQVSPTVTFTINADNLGQVNDANKANNVLSGTIYVNTN